MSHFSQWRRAHRRSLSHSAQVRLLRILIPATAALILLSLFLWSPLEDLFSSKGLTQGMSTQDLTLRNTVIKPQIHGVDAKGRPYHLQAQEAHQVTPDEAHLTNPQAQVLCEGNMQVNITSQDGTYQGDDHILNCQKQVQVTTSDGYTLEADKASVNFPTRQTQGQGTVHAHGPTGDLKGNQGFTLTQEGYLHVPGPSKLTLNPPQKTPSPALLPSSS